MLWLVSVTKSRLYAKKKEKHSTSLYWLSRLRITTSLILASPLYSFSLILLLPYTPSPLYSFSLILLLPYTPSPLSLRPVRHCPRQASKLKSSGRYVPLSCDAWRGQCLTGRRDTPSPLYSLPFIALLLTKGAPKKICGCRGQASKRNLYLLDNLFSTDIFPFCIKVV